MTSGALALFQDAYRANMGTRDAEARSEIDRVLTSKRVIFVSGKGGTGKSTVSALLALRAKALGLTPLVFECDAPTRPSLFKDGVRTSSKISEVSAGIFALNQPSEDAIRAYAAASLPSERLADLLLENRVSRLFLNAAPSVSEMALVGRVVQLAQSNEYSPVIVDLHSTGHALHILRAPEGIMRVLRAGPVFERARIVREFVFDESNVALLPVTIPEELPVTETLEFIGTLNKMNVPLGPVVLNAFFQSTGHATFDAVEGLANELDAAKAAWRSVRHWSERHERESGRFKEGVQAHLGAAHPIFGLPYLSDIPSDSTLAQSALEIAFERSGDA